MRELTILLREDITRWVGLFCPLCFAGSDKIIRWYREKKVFHLK
jgi:hypothetical protein